MTIHHLTQMHSSPSGIRLPNHYLSLRTVLMSKKMNYPAASCEVSNTMNMLIEQFDLITMYYLILLPLAFYIICYGLFVAIAANGVNVISAFSEVFPPKYFFFFSVVP